MKVVSLTIGLFFIVFILFASQFGLIRKHDGVLYQEDDMKLQVEVANISSTIIDKYLNLNFDANVLQVGLGRGLEFYLLSDQILRKKNDKETFRYYASISLVGIDNEIMAIQYTSERMESFPKSIDLKLYHTASENDIVEEGMEGVVWVHKKNPPKYKNSYLSKNKNKKYEKHVLLKVRKALFSKNEKLNYMSLFDWINHFDIIISTESLDILDDSYDFIRYFIKKGGLFIWCKKKSNIIGRAFEKLFGKSKEVIKFFDRNNIHIIKDIIEGETIQCTIGEK